MMLARSQDQLDGLSQERSHRDKELESSKLVSSHLEKVLFVFFGGFADTALVFPSLS